MGHETVLATLTLFGRRKTDVGDFDPNAGLPLNVDYVYVDSLDDKGGDGDDVSAAKGDADVDIRDLGSILQIPVSAENFSDK
jgi:hypothetical protein